MPNEMSVLTGPGNATFLKEMFPSGTEVTQGDTKLFWSVDRPDEVNACRETYNKLSAKGYLAFKMKDGEQGAQIHAFDPHAEKIIMVPRFQGGC